MDEERPNANDLQLFHDFLTNIGYISHSHVLTEAQNGAPWARERVARVWSALTGSLATMDVTTPSGAGLRSFDLGIEVSE